MHESPASTVQEPLRKQLSFFNFFTLCAVLLGAQFTWTVELGQGNPFLMSLGVPATYSYSVWLLGPISGFLTHPIVGAWSDNCTSKFGRRRPFIVGGVVVSILCFLFLALCREIGGVNSDGNATAGTLTIAIISFGTLFFAVNATQAAARALIMDMTPFSQQNTANLWASSMIHFGNIIGYATGFIDLKKLLNGKAGQFQILSVIGAIVLIATTCITTFFWREEVLLPSGTRPRRFAFITQPFIDVYRAFFKLPMTILILCVIQFFCWVGWFPLLFYATSYTTQVYTKKYPCKGGPLCEEGTRQGSLGSLYMATVAMVLSMVFFWMQKKQVGISMPRIWQAGSLYFAVLTWSTFFITDLTRVLVFNALIGVAWAIITWVPMAILGQLLTRNADDDLPVGIVLGINNIFVVLPQILVSLIGMGIAKLSPENEPYVPGTATDPIGWLMRLGGIAALISFFMLFWYIRILNRAALHSK